MKAVVLEAVGSRPQVRDVQLAEPGPGRVRVRIAASGVCHTDLSYQNGTLPGRMPCILGHEGAGVVEAVGPNVTTLKPDDHVILNWLPACGACAFCRRGESHLCIGRSQASEPSHLWNGAEISPLVGLGTMAEATIVPESAAVPIPNDVPLDIAALLGCGVQTGAGAAINAAKVEPGASVVVFGCGGVGINTIQGARICGAAIIVGVDPTASKLEAAKQFGATHTATPDELPALSRELTGGIGFDYSFEVVGYSSTIRAAYDAARRGGMCVVVGAGRMDDLVSFNALELFANEKKLIGSLYGSGPAYRDFPRLLALWKAGRLKLEELITRHIEPEQIGDAFDAMTRGDVIRQVIRFE